jgi:hypothetical protein
VVLELIEKHTSQVNIGVTSGLGTVWQDVFDQDVLEVLVSVWSISEVKRNIVRVLLAITRHGHNN